MLVEVLQKKDVWTVKASNDDGLTQGLSLDYGVCLLDSVVKDPIYIAL